jgi:hypothetical protein
MPFRQSVCIQCWRLRHAANYARNRQESKSLTWCWTHAPPTNPRHCTRHQLRSKLRGKTLFTVVKILLYSHSHSSGTLLLNFRVNTRAIPTGRSRVRPTFGANKPRWRTAVPSLEHYTSPVCVGRSYTGNCKRRQINSTFPSPNVQLLSQQKLLNKHSPVTLITVSTTRHAMYV